MKALIVVVASMFSIQAIILAWLVMRAFAASLDPD
jgi:hypothetical protein